MKLTRIGPDDQGTGLSFLAHELGVHDGVVRAFVLSKLEHALCFCRGSNKLLAQRCVIVARINPMISSDPDSIIAKNVLYAGFGYTDIQALSTPSVYPW